MHALIITKRCISLYRTSQWIHILGLPMLGFIYNSTPPLSAIPLLLTLVIGSLYLAHGYAVNDLFDTMVKYRNSPSQFYREKGISSRTALLFCYAPFFINLIIVNLLSQKVLWLVISGWVLSYIYSAPPVRLKSRPPFDLIINSMGFSILFLIGYGAHNTPDLNSLLMAGLFFILFLPLQLFHEITHLKQNQSENTTTVAARYGVKTAISLIFIFLIAFILWSFLLWTRGISMYIPLLSLIFALYITVYLKTYGNDFSKVFSGNVRMHVRFISIIYGIGMSIIFLFNR